MWLLFIYDIIIIPTYLEYIDQSVGGMYVKVYVNVIKGLIRESALTI